MQVVIIEDEKLAAENLELLMKQLEPDFQVMAKIETVRQAVNWLQNNTADLLFVDIMLADGNSFQIFEKVKVNIPVIFTTAYDQFAIKAFKLNSIGYLLKPINQKDLAEVINKYKELQSSQTSLQNIDKLIQMLHKPVEYQNRFIVYAGNKIKTVKITEIAYFQSKEGNTFLGTFDKHFYDFKYSLDQLENLLDPAVFFRINRQFIINIEAIEQMHVVSKSRIKLELKAQPDEETIVSVQHVPAFRTWLNK